MYNFKNDKMGRHTQANGSEVVRQKLGGRWMSGGMELGAGGHRKVRRRRRWAMFWRQL